MDAHRPSNESMEEAPPLTCPPYNTKARIIQNGPGLFAHQGEAIQNLVVSSW